VRGELPADDPPRVDVDDEREEDDALPAAQISQVGDPQLVRARCGEVALDQVGPPAGFDVGRGRAPRLAAALGALDAVSAHQPLHAAAPDVLAGTPQRFPHPA
jgi:hypothetical protein